MAMFDLLIQSFQVADFKYASIWKNASCKFLRIW